MKKIIFLLSTTLYSAITFGQQDPVIASYQFNQLPVNPGYAGVNDVTSFDLHYRSQWGDVDGAPKSMFISGNTSLIENQLGIGAYLVYDKIGVTKQTRFYAGGAYELEVTNNAILSFGLQVGILSLNYDFGELDLYDPTDEDFINGDDNITKLNFGTGLFFSADNYYVGFSIPQLLKVTEEIDGNTGDRYNRHFYLSGGIILDQFPTIKLKPYTLLRVTEGAPVSIDLGASALFADILWGGLFTRNFNSIGISAFLTTANNLRIGYTGELVTGGSQPSSGFSTHEITIGIDLELFENQAAVRRYY